MLVSKSMFAILIANSIIATTAAEGNNGCSPDTLPTLEVPHCNDGSTQALINKRLGTLASDFPTATVDLCYTDTSLEMIFTANSETSYLVNETFVNNDPIWMWTVMEAFIATGDEDPTHYLEFEVAPNNVTWTGFIHNPNKDFSSKATAFLDDLHTYPITSSTVRNDAAQTWTSSVSLALSLFNVEDPYDKSWRMNFFRTYYQNENSEQEYGAWNPNRLISFHQTECFGHVKFARKKHGCIEDELPSMSVPDCDDGFSIATINKRLGSLAQDFPEATVILCYTDKSLELTFKATGETSYLVNETMVNNDEIWRWTVMEAFIGVGEHAPTRYLEFEVAPNNVTWIGFIHNPNKDFTSKATAFVDDLDTYPITASTVRNEAEQTWTSTVSLPLSMFNVADPVNTKWRMNFFRTFYKDENSEQEYGAWVPNKQISFHQSECFGHVTLGPSRLTYGQASIGSSSDNVSGAAGESVNTSNTSNAAEISDNGTEWDPWADPSGGTMDNQGSRSTATVIWPRGIVIVCMVLSAVFVTL